jgi:hypothetical protein
MAHAKHFSVLEVLNFSDVGLVFEFYSTKDSNFMIDDLSRLTAKNVILTNEKEYSASFSNAILLKEYNATRARYSFTVAPQNFHSVIPILREVTGWISENCECTLDTKLKVSLSFDNRHLDTIQTIQNMQPSRMLLKFDESFVYERFPEQKGSPYALSVKTLAPISYYINESGISKNISMILNTPYAQFYGIDFTNYTRGVLECNYIGGKDYASKITEAKDVLEYFIIKAYQAINEENTTPFESLEMSRLTEGFDKMQMAYYDPEIFIKEFQNLKVYVDLKANLQVMKTYWNTIRGPLFEMIVGGGLREGQFNFDTDLGRFQLRKGTLHSSLTHDMDLVSCNLTGVYENCTFTSCKVVKGRLYHAKIISNNQIKESYLGNVTANSGNDIVGSVVENNEEMLNCTIENSVVKFATIGKHAKIDEGSTIVIRNVPLPVNTDAVKVEKIRDYTYIKDMNKSEDKGFQNEYIRKKM